MTPATTVTSADKMWTIVSSSVAGSPSLRVMVPRAYTIVGLACVAVLATFVAAGVSTGPLLGVQRLSDEGTSPTAVVHHPRVRGTVKGDAFPTWLTITLTVILALYALGLLALAVFRLHKRREEERDRLIRGRAGA